jgi:hypothetical protein
MQIKPKTKQNTCRRELSRRQVFLRQTVRVQRVYPIRFIDLMSYQHPPQQKMRMRAMMMSQIQLFSKRLQRQLFIRDPP